MKKKKCWLLAFSPFPTIFSKPFFCGLSCGTGLTLSQTTKFRLFQTQSVCRLQFQNDEKARKVSKRVEKTVGKREIAR